MNLRGLNTMATSLALLAATVASAQGVTLISPTNTIWRYLADGTDPGTEWALPDFDDSSWPQGRGLFGNDTGYPYPFNTFFPGPSQGGPVTVYFRTTFNWGSPSSIIFRMTNYFDDGVVIYLNGTELTRYNMPSGPVGPDTRAPGTLTEPVVRVHQISLDSLTNGYSNPLVAGTNVLAASVHNNAASSSDTVFGLWLSAGTEDPCFLGPIGPTNRTILEGRSTTFVVEFLSNCLDATFQWYRNVGAGEELIPGATTNAYTLTNAMEVIDEGVYYCRMSNPLGTVDSRQAVLTVFHCDCPPLFLSASVVGPGLNTFRLITDAELCGNFTACGGDYRSEFNWQIIQSDNTTIDLGVATVTKINPTTYEFTTQQPRDLARRYRITVHPEWGEISGLHGNPVPKGTFAETDWALFFQQGVAGYTGTQDAEIHSFTFADTPLGAATTMKADLDDGGVAQGLLRFENLFGSGPNQIPPGARIRSATLTLNQVDPGSAINLHRMLVTWDQSITTWNNLVDGVTANDVEARSVIDATIPTSLPNGRIELDVTTSIQAWANGQPNYGWALLSTGADGVTFNTSESGIPTAPLLAVAHVPGDPCGQVGFISQPPASVVVPELGSFTLAVGVSNAFSVLFQWTKNGVDIPGANQPSYTVQSASPSDSGTYRLRISCPFGPTITSNPSVVVIGDAFRPRLTWAAAESDGATITLRFSEPLNAPSAQNPANYTFVPPLAVVGAVLSSGNSTVTLTTAPREFPINHILRIANVANNNASPNLIDPNPTFVSLSSARVILPWKAEGWQYNTNNLDATPNWKNPDFTPGPDWGIGCSLFGSGGTIGPLIPWPDPICTPLIPNNVPAESELRVTTYFRKTIDLPALPAGARYVIGHYTDDGFIAYLDGEEIYRFAVPSGAVTFTSRSTGIPSGDATLRSFGFNATPGTHTLAVELHQAGVTSSDVLFGMEVRAMGGPSPSLSIAHSLNGGVNLNWNADGNWRLRSSTAVAGPYLDVAIPANSRFGTFTQPGASATNNSFYLLDYVCRP